MDQRKWIHNHGKEQESILRPGGRLGRVLFSVIVGSTLLFVLAPFRVGFLNNHGGDFTGCTGLAWPRSAKVLFARDTHYGFKNDGAFHLIFDADPETIREWLSAAPPWGFAEWSTGPVPTRIRGNCEANADDMEEPIELMAPMGKPEIRFVANVSSQAWGDWRTGIVIVIDPRINRIWLYEWKY